MAPHGWELEDKSLVELNKSAYIKCTALWKSIWSVNGWPLVSAKRLPKVFIEGERNDRLR